MPYKDPEKKKAHDKIYKKAYYWANKEEQTRKSIEWQKNNHTRVREKANFLRANKKRNDPVYAERCRQQARDSYYLHRDKRIEYQKSLIGTPKYIARYQARDALRKGIIIKPQRCEMCGSTKRLTMHHDDYSLPLNVSFLCHLCHGETHFKTKTN